MHIKINCICELKKVRRRKEKFCLQRKQSNTSSKKNVYVLNVPDLKRYFN